MDHPLSIKILILRRNKNPCLRVCTSFRWSWCSSVVAPSGLVTCSPKKRSVCPYAFMSPCFGPHNSERGTEWLPWTHLFKKWEWEAYSNQWSKATLKSSWVPGNSLWWPRSGEGRVACSVSRGWTSWSPLALPLIWNSLWPQCLSEANELRCQVPVCYLSMRR